MRSVRGLSQSSQIRMRFRQLNNAVVREYVFVALFLFGLAVVSLALYLPWLGLVGDDWWFFAHLSDGDFLSILLREHPARPGVAIIWAGLWQFFGLRPWIYYLLSFACQWLTSLLVFVMLRVLFHWSTANAAVIAALFLMCPADTAHPYLSTLAIRISALLAMAGTVLWLYTQTRPVRPNWLFVLSLTLMALSLLIYETPLFLLALLPFAQAFVGWRGLRMWLRQALSCYSVLTVYFVFRLCMAFLVTQHSTRYYASLNLSPVWLLTQLSAVLNAVTWKGWLYALKAMIDFGLATSAVMLIGTMTVLLLIFVRLQRQGDNAPLDWRQSLKFIGVGLGLSVAGAVPVIVSRLSLENAIGTIDGRLIHATALGYGLIAFGSCSLLSSLFIHQEWARNLLWSTTTSVLLALALISNLSVQRDYARSWQHQMSILNDLHTYANSWQDGTAILLLEVPAGAFDIRFYYPFTEMARRFYADPTLHILPWTIGFPPAQQTLAFGTSETVVKTEIVQGDTRRFDYPRIAGFRVDANGDLMPTSDIGTQYFLLEAREASYLSLPASWQPASAPVQLDDPQTLISAKESPDTEWRRWLLGQLAFVERFPMP